MYFINSLIIIVAVVVLTYLIKYLLPSYFKELGKNIATKRDVEEITKLVESVKHSFTEQTEHLKAQLTIQTNYHSSLISEEKEALISYNEKYNVWLNALTNPFGGVNDSNNEELERVLNKINSAYIDFLNSETRVLLYIENKELLKSAFNLKIETLSKFVPLAPLAIQNTIYANNLLNIYSKRENIDQQEKYKKYADEKFGYFKKFNEDILSSLKPIADLQNDFLKKSSVHLKSLFKEYK